MKILLALLMVISSAAFASKGKIEAWKKGEKIQYVVREDDGTFVSFGELSNESWNDGDDTSEWVARKKDGTLVTGFKGKLEKFKVKGKAVKKEQQRLVIRNARGEMVTWIAMDKFLESGFERMDTDKDGDKETVYVVRYKGQFVNWAKAKLESWDNYTDKVLVVRDTEDDKNNGKLLAWIPAEKMSNGQKIYRDPASGQFLSANE